VLAGRGQIGLVKLREQIAAMEEGPLALEN
jgi:hypothetical protein